MGYGSEQTNDGYRYRGKQNIGDRQLVREPCARIAGLVWSVVILPPGGPFSAGLGLSGLPPHSRLPNICM